MTPKQILVIHIGTEHRQPPPTARSRSDLQRWHANEHHRYSWNLNHFHEYDGMAHRSQVHTQTKGESMTEIRKEPCSSCPYRRDVPSGLWAAHEYDKLVDYDKPTPFQPMSVFGCHATPDHHCHGWAVVHSNRGHAYELFALRLWPPTNSIPEAAVPLFDSGQEAATWGQADIDDPSPEAREAVARLLRKYERLHTQDDALEQEAGK